MPLKRIIGVEDILTRIIVFIVVLCRFSPSAHTHARAVAVGMVEPLQAREPAHGRVVMGLRIPARRIRVLPHTLFTTADHNASEGSPSLRACRVQGRTHVFVTALR